MKEIAQEKVFSATTIGMIVGSLIVFIIIAVVFKMRAKWVVLVLLLMAVLWSISLIIKAKAMKALQSQQNTFEESVTTIQNKFKA